MPCNQHRHFNLEGNADVHKPTLGIRDLSLDALARHSHITFTFTPIGAGLQTQAPVIQNQFTRHCLSLSYSQA